MERLEIGRLLVREALWPTAIEDTAPCEGQGSHSSLGRLALVALLLGIDLGQKECRMDSAAHATNVCRRNGGPWRCLWPQDFVPRRSVPGARPAYFWRSSAAVKRARCSPKATRRRGAKTAPAPGKASTKGQSGWAGARCAMAASKAAMACKVTRSWATKAGPRRGLGAITPASVVSATAFLMALMRVVMTSAERTWWARKKLSRVVRRARWTAFRVGQRLRKSQKNTVSLYRVWHPPSPGPQRRQMLRVLGASWVLSQGGIQWCQGTCRRAFGEGIRERR
jgi:hypothetical protein